MSADRIIPGLLCLGLWSGLGLLAYEISDHTGAAIAVTALCALLIRPGAPDPSA